MTINISQPGNNHLTRTRIIPKAKSFIALHIGVQQDSSIFHLIYCIYQKNFPKLPTSGQSQRFDWQFSFTHKNLRSFWRHKIYWIFVRREIFRMLGNGNQAFKCICTLKSAVSISNIIKYILYKHLLY